MKKLERILEDEDLRQTYSSDGFFHTVIDYAISYDVPLVDTMIMIIRIFLKEIDRFREIASSKEGWCEK